MGFNSEFKGLRTAKWKIFHHVSD